MLPVSKKKERKKEHVCKIHWITMLSSPQCFYREASHQFEGDGLPILKTTLQRKEKARQAGHGQP